MLRSRTRLATAVSGANSIVTVEIAQSANSTARSVAGTSSRTEASARPGWKQPTEYYSRTVMSSFLASRASSEEKSDSRFVQSGRTKAPILFPCLHDPVCLSLFFSFHGTGRWSWYCLARSLSLPFAKGRGIASCSTGTLSVRSPCIHLY